MCRSHSEQGLDYLSNFLHFYVGNYNTYKTEETYNACFKYKREL